jgi:L-ascorbate metabolism protein UlaG (beta-lactamase superfamily)
MHYNTWELIVQDAAAWADTAATRGHAVKVLAPGDELTLG